MCPVRTMVIDIDLTLIDDEGNLYPGVKDKLLKNWSNKYDIIAWSHGGREHAQRILDKHGLLDAVMQEMKVYLPREKKWVTAQVPMCIDKPDIIVDDNPALILDYPARLVVSNPAEWWLKEDGELFKNSRDNCK